MGRNGAFAIIFDDEGRVLLSHRRDMDLWNLPGGGVEKGELPDETVVRETHEETGLEVVIERLVGVYGKTKKRKLTFSFLCRIVGGRLTATDEADENRWFAVESFPANTSPRHVERIRDAMKRRGDVIFRRHAAPSARKHLKRLGSD